MIWKGRRSRGRDLSQAMGCMKVEQQRIVRVTVLNNREGRPCLSSSESGKKERATYWRETGKDGCRTRGARRRGCAPPRCDLAAPGSTSCRVGSVPEGRWGTQMTGCGHYRIRNGASSASFPIRPKPNNNFSVDLG
jgi:hypothetical protein